MIQRIDLSRETLSPRELRERIPRADIDLARATESAAGLLTAVRERGEAALREQAERFDGGAPETLRVAPEALAAAADGLEPAVRQALEEAIRRVRIASAAQRPEASVTRYADGAVIEQRWQPVRRAGLYIPGGKAVYPSSVVMNVVAAQEAGVESIAVVSPPQREHGGAVHPTILGALALLGVDEVYAIGGAGAIGALAYGVDSLGLVPVDVITGPGNQFVAAAKQLVQSVVGIDAVAGATEILIIADESAKPVYLAADLISQAEHDESSGAVLVSDSSALLDAVEAELARQLPDARNHERIRAALSGRQSALVLVSDLEAAAELSDGFAPEHLELQGERAEQLAHRVQNAGAIFVGDWSPVSLGDYLAGSNHVLPTAGQARFSSGLGSYSFLRPQQIIRYDRDGLAEVAEHIVVLAESEGLPAHGAAVQRRFD